MNETRQVQLKDALEQILATLIAEYDPQKIILFGSLAEDTVGEWSDIDLAIIKETRQPFLDRLLEVALLCRAKVGVDYLVYTPDEFREMIDEDNPFVVREIVEKGKVVYERTAREGVVRESI